MLGKKLSVAVVSYRMQKKTEELACLHVKPVAMSMVLTSCAPWCPAVVSVTMMLDIIELTSWVGQ